MKRTFKMLATFIGMGIPVYFLVRLQQDCINRWKEQADKNQALFLIMDQWLGIKRDGRSLEEYFIKNNYHAIAIYGMEHLGQYLVRELKDTSVEVVYGIDDNCSNIYSGITMVPVEDDLLEADAVVVTALGEFDEISDVLMSKLNCPVIAIEDILNEI